ncbi:hypothetical protein LCGC14_2970660 [marine sediment metagenome]|uniref:Uncharacterized protein n=1 Tax=marine sediment metagenome TaxID=412755 RepID=A0A0F8X9G2_9ZZZZ
MKHTPKPWKAERIGSSHKSQSEKGMMHRITADSGDLRRVDVAITYYKPMAGEGDANARVIEQAPDMLEALQWTLHLLETLDNHHSHRDIVKRALTNEGIDKWNSALTLLNTMKNQTDPHLRPSISKVTR